MKFIDYILAVVVIGFVCTGCSKNVFNGSDVFTYEGQQASKTSEEAIGNMIRKIEVDNKFGRVDIRASDDSSTMTWEVTCWAKTEGIAEKFLDRVRLDSFKSGIDQSWTLTIPEKIGGITGLKSDFTITVPEWMKVEVHNTNGDTHVSGLAASVDLQNRNGNVLVQDLTGQCTINNTHGSIEARKIATGLFSNTAGNTTVSDVSESLTIKNSDGHVDVKNVAGQSAIRNNRGNLSVKDLKQNAELENGFGSLSAENISGKVSIKNQNGRITATGLDGQIEVHSNVGPLTINSNAVQVRCENQNGKIELNLTNPQIISVVATTSFNDISIVLPPALTPNFVLKAEHGKIESDFEENKVVQVGAPRVQLETRNGNLIIRKATK